MKQTLLLSFLLLFVLSGCGQAASTSENIHSSTDISKQYSITDFTGQKITFNKVPEHVVALSNGEMDIIYALGGKLVGRPTTSGKPIIAEAEAVEQIGTTHELDLEKITSVRPDVVLGNAQMNAKDVQTIQGLGAQMVLTEAQAVDDIKSQITLFGEMLQKQEKAKELIAQMEDKLQTLKTEKTKRVLLVYGAPGTYMAALPNSLSGNILEIAGGENIASDFPSLETYPQYAQLNVERIIEANPEYILLMSHGNPEEVKEGFMKEMEQNAAWNNLDAVKAGNVDILPADLFGTNPGTRVVDAVEYLVKILDSPNEAS